MPYKTGKLKGELTAPELRRLIKEHNLLRFLLKLIEMVY